MKLNDETLLAEVHKKLEYYADSGSFFWLEDAGTHRKGDKVGFDDGSGYLAVRLLRRIHKLHRLAWLVEHGRLPQGKLDHINGIRTDNRIENLRQVSLAVNAINRVRTGRYLQGVGKGERGRFISRIQLPSGKKLNLGRFNTEEEAAAAYIGASKVLHGEHSPADRLLDTLLTQSSGQIEGKQLAKVG